MSGNERELRWLRCVRDFSHQLASEERLSELLPRILDAAIEITESERGFLVRVLGRTQAGAPRLKVEVARGFDQTALQSDAGAISRTVVERVLDRGGAGLVSTSEEDEDLADVSSVKARRVVSILCAPLRLRGEIRGVLYLDHRFTKAAFGEEDLQILSTFADQAAVALETADLHADRAQADQGARRALDEIEALETPAGSEAESQPPQPPTFGRLVGRSPAMVALYREIERAARGGGPVLILGEPGTEAEAVAREIHARSELSAEPFLLQSCAAEAEEVLEGELFGHRRGATPRATTHHVGQLALAGKGTLLLQRIGDLSLRLQAKLLAVLSAAEVKPLGGTRARRVRCRVIATADRDLRALVEAGEFREDLYYHLDVLRLIIPPLRQRRADLPALIARFSLPGVNLRFSPSAQELLESYRWPGNLRELENETARLCSLDTTRISAKQLSQEVRDGEGVTSAKGSFAGKTLDEVEGAMLRAALRDCAGNKARAARQLGIPRSTIYHLIDRHGLAEG